MVTNIVNLSLNVARKMADAAEIEARKLGADVGIAVVAADASVYFSRSMDKVSGVQTRDIMKRALAGLENEATSGVVCIKNATGLLGALAIDGATEEVNQRCLQAALHIIEA
jgi:uncharacterized protein GlcG (DUF336 family)